MKLPLVLLLLTLATLGAQDDTPWPDLKPAPDSEPLPGTAPLEMEGDIASQLISACDDFLLRQIDASVEKRPAFWNRDDSSPEAYVKSVETNRQSLANMLGVSHDVRPEKADFEYIDWMPGVRAEGETFTVRQVRWNAFRNVHGMGLLLEPNDTPVADVIAIPDADQSPEEIAALPPFGSARTNDFALQLARAGCRVLVPMLINRNEHQFLMSNREWLHRPAFELGRTLAGYETQKILAGVDCLLAMQRSSSRKIAVAGWGEGGRIALYAAALDPRIDGACVGGYFGSRQEVWNEPADRNVFGLLREFGDAEIASLIAPRPLIIEHSAYPNYVFRPNENGEPEILAERSRKHGKPGKLHVPDLEEVRTEVGRARRLTSQASIFTVLGKMPMDDSTLLTFLKTLGIEVKPAPLQEKALSEIYPKMLAIIPSHDHVAERHAAQMDEIDRHNQWALIDSRRVRDELFSSLETDSVEAFEKDIERFRAQFRENVVGDFEIERLPFNARSRKYQAGPKTVSYEVTMDVIPGVFAYGILTLPKDVDLSGSEKRPVVVCQHGLEGRPQDVIGESKYKAYKAFATRLAERGFVTFAPQNIYIFFDRFRTLQFKANAVGCTLFSIMVPQHQQITGWLAEQPFVDAERIGFYGLSYGGKSAMRIPPLVDRYALSICSADFNEWIWKNAATDPRSLRYSYANKGEYEIFEFNLGNTFNYAEMARLICPRPFMVERGHFDGVAPDEMVGHEYARVRHFYAARLGIPERTEIEWFAGPHSINGEATYRFLEKHLRGENRPGYGK